MYIDLFSSNDFNTELIASILSASFSTFTYRNLNNPIGLFGFIGDLKVDFVKYFNYPIIEKTDIINGIRILSDEDLIAMKINAILRCGVKKDFWDISEMLNHYSLSDSIYFYYGKYKGQQLAISIPQALTYFEDAEESEEPISLKNQTWNSVKQNIQQKVREFLM